MSTDVLAPPVVPEDSRLGWLPLKLESNRDWQVAEILRGAPRPYGRDRNRWWKPGPTLDQLAEGQCVVEGIVGTHNGASLRLTPQITDYDVRRQMYHELQHKDPWTGCAWGPRCTIAPSSTTYGGTSVHAGLMEGRRRGWWSSFRWLGAGSGQLETDLVETLATVGPVVVGTAWKSSMYETRPSGLMDLTGDDVGGHCYRYVEWIPRLRLPSEWRGTREAIAVHQSWGDGWGIKRRTVTGIGYVLLEDALALLEDGGEAAVVLP